MKSPFSLSSYRPCLTTLFEKDYIPITRLCRMDNLVTRWIASINEKISANVLMDLNLTFGCTVYNVKFLPFKVVENVAQIKTH